MKRAYEIINKGGKKGQIRIVGEINWWRTSSEDFTKQVDLLLSQGVEDLEGYINTPGGDMFEANEIGNQISRFKGSKTVKLGALCASAGTTISTYFDSVEAASNTQYMIHDPATMAFISHEEDYETSKQLYTNLRNNAIERYVEKTGLSKEEVSDMMKKTTWMDAKTALKKGFVDSISNEKESLPADTKNVLAQFKFANVPEIVNQEIKNKTIKMTKVTKKLGVSDEATEDEQVAVIEKLHNSVENGIKVLVSMGVAKGFKKETFERIARADMDAALDLLETAPAQTAPPAQSKQEPPVTANQDNTRISDLINELKAQTGKTTTTKEVVSLSKLEKENPAAITDMIRNKPEEYQKLFKLEYGKECSLEDIKKLV